MSLMLFALLYSTFPAFPLHPCDLTEAERALILDKFLHATMKWNQNAAAVQSGNENEEQKSHMIVATDACLPLITSSGESSISSNFLINYQLPTKKETYTRRMATCLAADGTVINMVVGGEAVTLKSIEESSRLVIAEMPINRFLKCSKDVILQVRGRELLGRGGFVHCALSFKY